MCSLNPSVRSNNCSDSSNGCVVLVKELQLQPLQIHLLNTAWLQVARTFPHQLTRKQLKLLDMCWTCVTCVTCGYCIWSNDAEQFAWYDIHLCNWLHQETVWNFSTDLDSWFRGWHCGCSAVSKFIQDVRESKLSQLIHTVGRIFGACDQAYLLRRPCSYPKAVATRIARHKCDHVRTSSSELAAYLTTNSDLWYGGLLHSNLMTPDS